MKKLPAFFRSTAGSVVQILLGVFLMANPDFGSVLISVVIGWGLLIFGGLALVYGILNRQSVGIVWPVISVLVALVGIYVLRRPLMLAKLLGFLLGLYLICQGVGTMRSALRLRQAGYGYSSGMGLAVLLLVFGAILMFLPLTTSRLLMTLVGLGILACGIVNLVVRARTDKKLRGGSPDIVDADP